MRTSPQADIARTGLWRDADGIPHPAAYASLMDTAEYRTGLELCRQEVAERASETGDMGVLHVMAMSMQPWGEHSAALGLTEGYIAHLIRTGERPSDPDETAQKAYCTEQFVKRFHVERGETVVEPAPSRLPAALPRTPLSRMGRRDRCTFVRFAVPMRSPWQGHPYVGGYLDPRLGLDSPNEPDSAILLVTDIGESVADEGFWPLYRALNRTTAVYAERDAECDGFVDELAAVARAGGGGNETVLAVARLIAILQQTPAVPKLSPWLMRRNPVS